MTGLVGVTAPRSEVCVSGVAERVLCSPTVLLCSGVMQVGVERVAGEFSTDPMVLVLRPCKHRLSASRLFS